MNKEKKRFNYLIPKRFYLLFSMAVCLMLVLVARLAYMQLLNRDFYIHKLATASKKKITLPSVRGEIFDAKGRILVASIPKQVVTFTRLNTMTGEELKKTAQKLYSLVDLTSIRLTNRQIVDYYLADSEIYRQVVESLPSDKRLTNDGNLLPESEIYQNAIASVDSSSLEYSEEEKKIAYLYSQMNAVANFETGVIVTDDLTAEQAALIAAGGNSLPGISLSNSWERQMTDSSLSGLLGKVSREGSGLPAEEAKDYLKKGYALNDRVGISYLEKEYEEELQGSRVIKEVNLDKNGNFENIQTVTKGEKGKNLKLTIDSDFQSGVENILKKYFETELAKGNATFSEGVYAVALDPDSGSVLAMTGIKHDLDTGVLETDSLGAYTNVFVPGSVVKGATLTAGWENGAIIGNQVLIDQPITLSGMNVINSWFTQYGSQSISAVQALEYSSNSYMVQMALDLLNAPYGSNQEIDDSQVQSAMEKLRFSLAEYGLGVKTGIDLPNESIGYLPTEYTFGSVLTNSFGQFDNYTTLQLAQYVATVANGGKRISPHLVEGVYQSDSLGKLGTLETEIKTQELNKVNISEEEMSLIQSGFYSVVHGGSGFTTGGTLNQGAITSISAKTGTAETNVKTNEGQIQNTINTNVVAYAPSTNPQIAVAVVFPHNTDLAANISHVITRDIINLFISQQEN
ncbi:Cell division protein FtsI (Peptidoglycan synthetase) [Streptococcus sp. DD10]|uniref:penicillin-binding protein PBP2B n=1 Tax=Streptococcus sp. DD10 TaxID=1777878 RepID=UPI0007956D5A|nr:penicillin-binding protein PBP2B [Streptococcus sp. DD10]KXT75078.1 Cell division protein FtsI (Peptidoglycan synthetase) [Streptococcus sp. DD10]